MIKYLVAARAVYSTSLARLRGGGCGGGSGDVLWGREERVSHGLRQLSTPLAVTVKMENRTRRRVSIRFPLSQFDVRHYGI